MDIQEKIIKEMASDLEAKKKQVLLNRLSELNIDLDLEKEQKRRFKSLQSVSESFDTETIYYNDGSEDGLRVVTFQRIDSFPTMDDFRTMSIKSEIKYY